FFFQAEDGIRDFHVTGVQTCALPISVALLIWAMIYPMMVAVDFDSIRNVGTKPKGLIITVVINWLIKPFTMAALAVLFFDYVYRSEERRVGKGGRSRRSPYVQKKGEE